MLPPADATAARDSGRIPPRPPSWILRIAVAAGVGILVLLGWSAAASAAGTSGSSPGATSADGLTGGVTTGAVSGAVSEVVAPVALPAPPTLVTPPPAPVVAPPSTPVVDPVGTVAGTATALPVPPPPTVPPAGVIPPPTMPGLPTPPTAPPSPFEPPTGPVIVPPAEGIDALLPPPIDGPGTPAEGLLPPVAVPAWPGSVPPPVAGAPSSAVSESAATAAATGTPSASSTRTSVLSDEGSLAAADPRVVGLSPIPTPSGPDRGHHGGPATAGSLPSCSTSGSVDRAPAGGPSSYLFGTADGLARSRAHALLGDQLARASSIARARPGFAPD